VASCEGFGYGEAETVHRSPQGEIHQQRRGILEGGINIGEDVVQILAQEEEIYPVILNNYQHQNNNYNPAILAAPVPHSSVSVIYRAGSGVVADIGTPRRTKNNSNSTLYNYCCSFKRILNCCFPNYIFKSKKEESNMVQMFYYENRGKCCKKLLRYNGYPNKVRTNKIIFLLLLHVFIIIIILMLCMLLLRLVAIFVLNYLLQIPRAIGSLYFYLTFTY
jgi:hypothetical protein